MKRQCKQTWKKTTRKQIAKAASRAINAVMTFSDTDATMRCAGQVHTIHRTNETDRTWGERIYAHWLGFVDNNRRRFKRPTTQLALF